MAALASEVSMGRRADLRRSTSVHEATEERLRAWGRERRRAAASLGCPGASTIAMMIEKVKVFERQSKGVRIKALRKVDGKRPWDVDAKVAAEEFRYVEPALSAQGKESVVMSPTARISFSSETIKLETIIQRLSGDMKKYIYRAYFYGQPDRFIAKELGLEREYVTLRRRGAVAYVAERLAGREFGAL